MKNLTLTAILAVIAAAGLTACDRASQEKAEDAAHRAGDAVEQVYDNAKDAAEDVYDRAEDVVDETEDKIQDRFGN